MARFSVKEGKMNATMSQSKRLYKSERRVK